jgi:phage terminase small subunit
MSAVAELRAEVLKLRGEGLSFSKVAKQLGISKAYAVRLGQSDRSQEPATGHKNGHKRSLNVRQRRFVAGIAEGKTKLQAALDAGASPRSAQVWASQTMRNPKVQETFTELLDRKGLSDERLAEIHAENLAATKVVAVGRNMQGDITELVEKPDYSTRQRAVKDAWSLRGRLGSSDSEGSSPQFNISLVYSTAKKIEAMTGRKILPVDFEPVEDEPAPSSPEASEDDSAAPAEPKSAQAENVVWGDW